MRRGVVGPRKGPRSMPPSIAHHVQGARPLCRAFVYVVTAAFLGFTDQLPVLTILQN